MERVADTVSPQPVCAVVGRSTWAWTSCCRGRRSPDRDASGLVLVCVDVRDPGNLGAVLRIAGATGVAGVICCAGTVDPYNPKVVRASAGAVFRVPLVAGAEPGQALETLGGARIPVLGDGSPGRDGLRRRGPRRSRRPSSSATKGPGLPAEVVDRLDGALTIPMADGTESLNVAMTAAVLCFEAARRRRPAASSVS